MDSLFINQKLSIPESQLTVTFSRSSGPGGQNVNKLNTRVTVSLDVANCPEMTDTHRRKILRKLKNRIDKEGHLQVTCQDFRSQHANRNAAKQRLAELIADALKPVKKRKPTKKPKSAVEKRLQDKKQQAEKKKQRSQKPGIE